jgi:hypothetical protein
MRSTAWPTVRNSYGPSIGIVTASSALELFDGNRELFQWLHHPSAQHAALNTDTAPVLATMR